MPSRPASFLAVVLTSAATVCLAATTYAWQKEEPSQWTSEDVYQILNNSPWTKSTNVNITRNPAFNDPSTSGNNGTWGSGNGMPGGMGRSGGGLGNGGMGGGGIGGGGMGRGRNYPSSEAPADVTVQWESALPVRLAEEKLSNHNSDPASLKPLGEYIIAVVGLPKSGLNSQLSRDPNDVPDDGRLADHLKVVTVLTVGHERLNPTKVELNQGRDARPIFHFEKSEPITLHDKDVEFRITTDNMDLRRRFALKDMMYQGNLAL
jgi:hypothetical protein